MWRVKGNVKGQVLKSHTNNIKNSYSMFINWMYRVVNR